MVRFAWRHLRGRPGRSTALLAGVLLATCGFVVLTAATTTSRLQVTGAVDANARAAYDILVRPAGERTDLETQRGLVRGDYLSSQLGGITMQQLQAVRSVPGVQVAAPIAMVGYASTAIAQAVDLTELVDRAAERQVLRLDPTFAADRGLSTAAGAPSYVYVTKRPLFSAVLPSQGESLEVVRFTNGQTLSAQVCGGDVYPLAVEVQPDGSTEPICGLEPRGGTQEIFSELDQPLMFAARLLPDGRFQSATMALPGQAPAPADRLLVPHYWTMPMLLAGIDPVAEDNLVGLASAMTMGRYLSDADRPASNGTIQDVPTLAANTSWADAAVTFALSRVDLDRAKLAGLDSGPLHQLLSGASAHQLGSTTQHAASGYARTLSDSLAAQTPLTFLPALVQSGPVGYDIAPDGTLVPRGWPADPGSYADSREVGVAVPWQAGDRSFRAVRSLVLPGNVATALTPVGAFDPKRLARFNPRHDAPLQVYQPAEATGADDRSRELLGGQPLRPGTNPGGYLLSPPLLLTTLESATSLLQDHQLAPLSAIRVKVAGLSGSAETMAERVRLVAEDIATVTGLDVDVIFGSSRTGQTVELAEGSYGRPALRLTESWSKKGVASMIVTAVDRKSAALFLLVLVVCALFLANAVTAAIRDRRTGLAVLSCLGWPARRIAASILIEVALAGACAGVLALALAIPVGHLLDLSITWSHAASAVPIAVGLTIVAAAIPALRSARAHPAGALRAPDLRPKRAGSPRSVVGLGLANLARVPSRTILAAMSVALGVAALTVLAAVTFAFHGALVGSVLGDAVSVQVRGVDIVAALATMALSAFAVADVLYLNIRDRAAELAALAAMGWSTGTMARMIAAEGCGIGMLGSAIGAATGVGITAWLVGEVSGRLLAAAAAVSILGALSATVAAVIPALLIRGLPVARLLAEE